MGKKITPRDVRNMVIADLKDSEFAERFLTICDGKKDEIATLTVQIQDMEELLRQVVGLHKSPKKSIDVAREISFFLANLQQREE